MDLTIGNCSAKRTFTIMDDKDDHISLGDDFGPFEPLETHLSSRESKLPRVVGEGYHFVDTNPVIVVTATHDVVEYSCSKVPDIFPGTYPSLAWMRAPNVTRYVISKRAV